MMMITQADVRSKDILSYDFVVLFSPLRDHEGTRINTKFNCFIIVGIICAPDCNASLRIYQRYPLSRLCRRTLRKASGFPVRTFKKKAARLSLAAKLGVEQVGQAKPDRYVRRQSREAIVYWLA